MHFGNLFGIRTKNKQKDYAVPLKIIHSFISVGIVSMCWAPHLLDPALASPAAAPPATAAPLVGLREGQRANRPNACECHIPTN